MLNTNNFQLEILKININYYWLRHDSSVRLRR